VDETTYSLGYWVQRRRKALDLTRAALAARVSCSLETIKKIERDERRPSREVARLLAEALELNSAEMEAFLQAVQKKRSVDSLPLPHGPISDNPHALPHNLPTLLTPFIGRQKELEAIENRLGDPACRLLTLVGPGGTGKTRLALQAAYHRMEHYADGTYFAYLAGAAQASEVPGLLASCLGLTLQEAGESSEAVLRHLKDKNLLLIFDNYEHLLPETGLLNHILTQAPRVDLMVTSRERLSLQSEWVFEVGGLELPDPEGAFPAAASPAVELFAQTARRIRPEFILDETNAEPAAEICRLVGGMPLAIELAAAWVPAMELHEIAIEIQKGLDLLEADLGDLPERQRSMRLVFDASWHLLSLKEQQQVQMLAVFQAGFTRQAAEGAFGISSRSLRRLVNKCWVQPETLQRFYLHELVRQYAFEKLHEDPQFLQSIQEDFSAWFCRYLGEQDYQAFGENERILIAAIQADIHNIETAWSWACQHHRADLLEAALTGLAFYYKRSSRLVSGLQEMKKAAECLEVAASTEGPPSLRVLQVRARALIWQGIFSEESNEYSHCNQEAGSLLDRLETMGCDTRADRALLLSTVGGRLFRTDPAAAWDTMRRSKDLYHELEDPIHEADVAHAMSNLAWLQGSFEQGLELSHQCLKISRSAENRWMTAWALNTIGVIYLDMGMPQESASYCRESREEYRLLGFKYTDAMLLFHLCLSQIYAGQFDAASETAEEMASWLEWTGHRPYIAALTNFVRGAARMHKGEYSHARALLEKSVGEAEKGESSAARFAALNLYGSIHLAEGSFELARDFMQKAYLSIRMNKESIFIGLPLLSMSYVYLAENRLEEARLFLRYSMREPAWWSSYRTAVYVLPVLALLAGAEGDLQRAVELYAAAENHPMVALSKWFYQVAGRQIAAYEARLPPEAGASAREGGRKLDLWQVIQDLQSDHRRPGETRQEAG
jgi:predicted ATPase/transcriptional regulator with XRE-family HTH domain